MTDAVYAVAQIQVRDHKQYVQEYGLPTMAVFQQYGGEVLAATPQAQTVEGEWFGNWTVIVRFPSTEKAQAFYESPEYAGLKQARIERLSDGGNLVFVPALAPASIPAR